MLKVFTDSNQGSRNRRTIYFTDHFQNKIEQNTISIGVNENRHRNDQLYQTLTNSVYNFF